MINSDTALQPIKVVITYRVLQAWRVPIFQYLAENNHIDLHVIYGEEYENSKLKNFNDQVNFKITKLKTIKTQIKTQNGIARIPFQIGLWRLLRKINPDIIISEGASHLLGNILSYVYCQTYNKHLVQWGLGKLQGRKVSKLRSLVDNLFFRKIEQNSKAAIAYSSIGVEYYRSIGMPKNSVFLAVNTVDTKNRIRDMKGYCYENNLLYPSPVPAIFKIIFIGAITEGKRFDILLHSFAKLLRLNPSAKLQIIGDGDKRFEMEALSENLKLTQSVEFIGHKSDSLAQYFYDASIMVLPGLGGLAISDALCHGVPVFCHIGDGSEIDLIDGKNGMIIPQMSIDNLTYELSQLALDVNRQKSYRLAALNKIITEHNVENYIEKILTAIRYCTELHVK